MHKAAVALLAAPIIVAVYVGALMRRSTLARVSLAVGLSPHPRNGCPQRHPDVRHGRHTDDPDRPADGRSVQARRSTPTATSRRR